MNRAEKFALAVAIFGLVDAVLSIFVSGVALAGTVQQPQQIVQNNSQSDVVRALALLSLLYSWIVISWYLLRRYFLSWSKLHYEAVTTADQNWYLEKFQGMTWRTIIGLGVLFWPLVALLSLTSKGSELAAFLWFVGILGTWLILSTLMPIIYPEEMDIDDLFVFPF